jgi:hypothetical protein
MLDEFDANQIYRILLYNQALNEAGYIGFQRYLKSLNSTEEKLNSNKLNHQNNINLLLILPSSLEIEVCDFLDLTDVISLSMTCKSLHIGASGNVAYRWSRMKETIENIDEFIERFSDMHSWYKHLGSGREVHFCLLPSKFDDRFHAPSPVKDKTKKSYYTNKYGLHWHNTDKTNSLVPAPLIKSVNLNCFYGKRNIGIAYRRVSKQYLESMQLKHNFYLTNNDNYYNYTYFNNRDQEKLAALEYEDLKNKIKKTFLLIIDEVFSIVPIIESI